MFKGFQNVYYKRFSLEKEMVDGSGEFTFNDLSTWTKKWAIVVPYNIVVVDVDNIKEADCIFKICQSKSIKTYISKTSRGYHFYFKIPKFAKLANKIDAQIPIGCIDVDYRSGQKKDSKAIECTNGVWNEWIGSYIPQSDVMGNYLLRDTDLDELPFWLMPLKHKHFNNSLVGLTEGDGRDNILWKLKSYLISTQRLTELELKQIMELINEFVFAEGFSENVLNKFTNKEGVIENQKAKWFDNKGNFLHHEMAKYLGKELFAWRDKHNLLWYYNGKYYTRDVRILEKIIAYKEEILKDFQIQEVITRFNLLDSLSPITPTDNGKYICVKNGLVDISNGKLINFTNLYFVNKQLNVTYDEKAFDENVDRFLNDVLVEKGDKEQRMIFEEYLGYTICFNDNSMKKMLFMIGPQANNGKTTSCAMVQEILGSESYSVLKLFEIKDSNEKKLVELDDKLANFDDDANDGIIKEDNMSYLKTLISDENKITINPKYERPYKSFIKAKFWVTSNHILKTSQKGNEWMTRMLILSFNNVFVGKKRNPFLKNLLRTENAKSYLLNLALKGAQRLRENGDFTISKESEKQIFLYKLENNSVLRFLYQGKYKETDFDKYLIKTMYLKYLMFMEDDQLSKFTVGMDKFASEVINYFEGKLTEGENNNQRIFQLSLS